MSKHGGSTRSIVSARQDNIVAVFANHDGCGVCTAPVILWGIDSCEGIDAITGYTLDMYEGPTDAMRCDNFLAYIPCDDLESVDFSDDLKSYRKRRGKTK